MEHVVIEGAARHYTRRMRGLIIDADAGACCWVVWDGLALIVLQRGLKGASRRLVLDPQVSFSLAGAVVSLCCRRGLF